MNFRKSEYSRQTIKQKHKQKTQLKRQSNPIQVLSLFLYFITALSLSSLLSDILLSFCICVFLSVSNAFFLFFSFRSVFPLSCLIYFVLSLRSHRAKDVLREMRVLLFFGISPLWKYA